MTRFSFSAALYLEDFRDTAAVMLQCDLVISADTSVAHMAATLGIPTWVLIPKLARDHFRHPPSGHR